MVVGAGARRDELVEAVVDQARRRVTPAQADVAEALVRCWLGDVAPAELATTSPVDLRGAALAHWDLARRRAPDTPLLRIYTPVFDQHGWQSSHTVLQIVTDDMPFLVDSVTMALNRAGYGIHHVVHPIIDVRRDAAGEVEGIGGGQPESFIHVEFDRQSDADALHDLHTSVTSALSDVRAAVEDWPAMREVASDLARVMRSDPPVVDDEIDEVAALLEWMVDDHFTFLGYREYELTTVEGEEVLRTVAGTGLGILREHGRVTATSFAKLPPAVRRKAKEHTLLNLTKANSRSTVHR